MPATRILIPLLLASAMLVGSVLALQSGWNYVRSAWLEKPSSVGRITLAIVPRRPAAGPPAATGPAHEDKVFQTDPDRI